MSEPIEVVTICLAGLSALSTLAVALLGPSTKPRPKKFVQYQLDFDENRLADEKIKDKVLAGHH